jgi:Fe2+ or Zn2+ uptake regulation protein
MTSNSERVRNFLLKAGIDTPASVVVKELNDKGCQVTSQTVYNVRSLMKANNVTVKVKNTRSLSDYIFDAIKTAGKALCANEIASRIKSAGYSTNAKFIVQTVRMQCSRLLQKNQLVSTEVNGVVWYDIPTTKTDVATEAVTKTTPTLNIVSLVAVGRLVQEIGGIEIAKQYLHELELLQDKNQLEVLEFANRFQIQTK